MNTSKNQILFARRLFLVLVTLLSVWLGFSTTTSVFPTGDAMTYGRVAYNLFQYGSFSSSTADRTDAVVSNYYDNPLVPLYFAGVLKLFFSSDSVSLSCLQALPQATCPAPLLAMKMANMIWLLALSTLAFFVLRDLRPAWIKTRYGLFALLALNVSFLTHVDTFLTEGWAAFFLLGFSFCLYKLCREDPSSRSRQAFYASAGILCYSLLIALKAVYFYMAPLLLLSAALMAWKQRTWHRPFLIVLIALCGFGSATFWEKHNEHIHGQKILSLTGLNVLAARAEYSTMTWREYRAAYFAFLPDLGPLQLKQRLLERFFDYEDYRRFRGMDDNEKTFHGGWPRGAVGSRALNEKGEVDYSKLKSAAFSVIREHWIMHIALVPVFALSGSFVTVGFLPSGPDAGMAELMLKTGLRFATMLYSLFLYPALLTAFLYAWRRGEYRLLLFFMPVLYAYAFHAAITHFTPRYSMPAIPVLMIAIFLAAGYIAQSLNEIRHKRQPLQP